MVTRLAGQAGPAVVVGLVLALVPWWLLNSSSGQGTVSGIGQLAGAESVLMMSLGMVLISTLPVVDKFFDGLDRAAIWHRRLAIAGLLLLVPHILMSHGPGGPGWAGPGWAGPAGVVATIGLVSLAAWAILPRWRSFVPRAVSAAVGAAVGRALQVVHDWPPVRWLSGVLGNYEWWRALHRTTGLFLGIGFAHGLVDATVFDGSAALRWSYVGIGGVGLAFYLFRELLARRGWGITAASRGASHT